MSVVSCRALPEKPPVSLAGLHVYFVFGYNKALLLSLCRCLIMSLIFLSAAAAGVPHVGSVLSIQAW